MYETRRIIVAMFSIRNIDKRAKKLSWKEINHEIVDDEKNNCK